MTPTRFELPDGQKLAFDKFGPYHWQFIHIDIDKTKSQIGPIYKTKSELLADLGRYATEFGFNF